MSEEESIIEDEEEDEEEEDEEEEEEEDPSIKEAKVQEDIQLLKDIFSYIDQTSSRITHMFASQARISQLEKHIQTLEIVDDQNQKSSASQKLYDTKLIPKILEETKTNGINSSPKTITKVIDDDKSLDQESLGLSQYEKLDERQREKLIKKAIYSLKQDSDNIQIKV